MANHPCGEPEPVAYLITTIRTGETRISTRPVANLPYNRDRFTSQPLFTSPPPSEGENRMREAWRPIAEADKDIAYIHDFGEVLRIGNSYPIWARDSDGRVYEALWADDGKKAYWWDIEGESPVDPVEFMPHPLDPRFLSCQSSGNGEGRE